jgi:Ca2+-binding RTX toxin-like protein
MREKMHGNTPDRHRMIAAAVAEALEPRRLLAGIESGILVARGTEGTDTISTRRTGTDDVIVTTNGVSQTFDMDDFTGVRLEGLGGDDTFRLIDPLTSPLVRNTTVIGGAGNDTISYATRTAALNVTVDPARGVVASGAQTDEFLGVETIVGGAGNDVFDYGNFVEIPADQREQVFPFRVEGRGGNDTFNDRLTPTLDDNFDRVTLFGGDGDDVFNDDENPGDQFFGEAGNDVLNLYENFGASGGSGIDTMSVFTWDDTVVMPPDVENLSRVGTGAVNAITVIGNDLSNRIDLSEYIESVTVQGLGGNDTIIGSSSEDSLVGGFGDDSLDGGEAVDTVDGGPGNDTLVNAEVQPGAGSIGRVGRTLIADGSWGQDLITIERVGTDDVIVRVNETSRTFDMDDFDAVLLRGNNGFDELRVLEPVVAGSLVRPITLLGGNGADTLLGSDGSSNEVLDGGEGNDFLDTRDFFGGDTAIGGNGTDSAVVDAGDTTSGVETIT